MDDTCGYGHAGLKDLNAREINWRISPDLPCRSVK